MWISRGDATTGGNLVQIPLLLLCEEWQVIQVPQMKTEAPLEMGVRRGVQLSLLRKMAMKPRSPGRCGKREGCQAARITVLKNMVTGNSMLGPALFS